MLVGPSTSSYGLLVYEAGEYGTGWYDYSDTGDLAVQLILRGGNVPDYDVALQDLFTDARYYAQDGTLRLGATLVNTGAKAIPGLNISLSFDGNAELGGMMQIQEEVTGSMQLPLEVELAQFGLAAGQHTLTLTATSLADGTALSPLTAGDDAVSTTFYVYADAVERKASLLEVFTSTDSRYAELFTAPVEQFIASREDVIPVFIHGTFGANDSDPLAVQGAADLAKAAGVSSTPSFGINRTAAAGRTEYLYAYTAQPAADDFTELLDYLNATTPSFATVALDCSYNETSRLLTMKVTGERTADFSKFFNYGALTIYLTEDGVDGNDHVLRRIVTSTLGNVISWNQNGGLAFSRDFRTTLDAAGRFEAVGLNTCLRSKQVASLGIPAAYVEEFFVGGRLLVARHYGKELAVDVHGT